MSGELETVFGVYRHSVGIAHLNWYNLYDSKIAVTVPISLECEKALRSEQYNYCPVKLVRNISANYRKARKINIWHISWTISRYQNQLQAETPKIILWEYKSCELNKNTKYNMYIRGFVRRKFSCKTYADVETFFTPTNHVIFLYRF